MDGWLLYRNWNGTARRIRVRDCKDPSSTIDSLTALVGAPVMWQPA